MKELKEKLAGFTSGTKKVLLGEDISLVDTVPAGKKALELPNQTGKYFGVINNVSIVINYLYEPLKYWRTSNGTLPQRRRYYDGNYRSPTNPHSVRILGSYLTNYGEHHSVERDGVIYTTLFGDAEYSICSWRDGAKLWERPAGNPADFTSQPLAVEYLEDYIVSAYRTNTPQSAYSFNVRVMDYDGNVVGDSTVFTTGDSASPFDVRPNIFERISSNQIYFNIGTAGPAPIYTITLDGAGAVTSATGGTIADVYAELVAQNDNFIFPHLNEGSGTAGYLTKISKADFSLVDTSGVNNISRAIIHPVTGNIFVVSMGGTIDGGATTDPNFQPRITELSVGNFSVLNTYLDSTAPTAGNDVTDIAFVDNDTLVYINNMGSSSEIVWIELTGFTVLRRETLTYHNSAIPDATVLATYKDNKVATIFYYDGGVELDSQVLCVIDVNGYTIVPLPTAYNVDDRYPFIVTTDGIYAVGEVLDIGTGFYDNYLVKFSNN